MEDSQGASKGPAIGHVSPEAAVGGPIALVEENDLIEIDIEKRILQLVGVDGQKLSEEAIDKVLVERKAKWGGKRENKYKSGILKIFSERAVSPMKGGIWNNNISVRVSTIIDLWRFLL